jgi:hypothetical protein
MTDRRSDRDSASKTSSKQPAQFNGATTAKMMGVADTPTLNLESIKMQNLIRWNVEVLAKTLKQVIGSRIVRADGDSINLSTEEAPQLEIDRTPLEEVVEVIELPEQAQKKIDVDAIVLSSTIMEELADFVTNVAALYRLNPFHNFEVSNHE